MKATEVINKIEAILKVADSMPKEMMAARQFLYEYQRLLEQALEETEVKIR